jgi:glucose uptake protein GlcU
MSSKSKKKEGENVRNIRQSIARCIMYLCYTASILCVGIDISCVCLYLAVGFLDGASLLDEISSHFHKKKKTHN